MSTDKKHSIDKLFHESLQGQQIQPGGEVWHSLSNHIPAQKGSRTLYYVLGTAAIALISLVIYTGMFGIFRTTQLSDAEQENTAIKTESPVTTEQETSEQPEDSQESSSLVIDTQEEEETAPLQESIAEPLIASEQIDVSQKQLVPTIVQADNEQAETYSNRTSYPLLPSLYTENSITEDPENKEDFLEKEVLETPSPIFNMQLENSYVRKADVLFGAGFSPAVNMYPDGQNRNDYSFELIVDYEKSRFFIEGGLGANYATESVKYGISYSSYDSVGYFVNVNAFTFDPENPDSIHFQTSFKNIYDSIDHYNVQENTNKYAYLQIPVRFGYRVYQSKRFSLDVKAGIIFSWQIMKDVPDIPYGGSDAEIEVIRQYPDRLKVNWQYSASMGINYHINKQLRFTLEPFYRQYLKSVYSTDSEYSARSPYAIGLRGGIYIQF